ncbi:MAG: glycosyltransferase [Verrucomicrobiota bacterium]
MPSDSPENEEALQKLNQGIEAQESGNLPSALELFAQATALTPQDPQAHYLLGQAQLKANRNEEARLSLETALQIEPEFALAHTELAAYFQAVQNAERAIAHYHRSIEIDPDQLGALFTLGELYASRKLYRKAAEQYRLILKTDTNQPAVWDALILSLSNQDEIEEAERAANEALKTLRPTADLYFAVACIQRRGLRIREAQETLQKALEINAQHTPSKDLFEQLEKAALFMSDHSSPSEMRDQVIAQKQKLFRLNLFSRKYREAEETLIDLLDHAPSDPSLLRNYIRLLIETRRFELCDYVANRLMQLWPDRPADFGMVAMLDLYRGSLSTKELADKHLRYAEHINQAANKLTPSEPLQALSTEGKLSVAFFSGDFREHSVSYFLEPLFAHWNHELHSLHLYSMVEKPDAITERLKSLADSFTDIRSLNDEALINEIRSTGIDIAIDLSGNFTKNRLTAFAVRLAPIQGNWLGYPHSLGIQNMDFRMVDEITDPPANEDSRFETSIRLSQGFLCYAPPQNAPEVAPLPAEQNGSVTFGSFNNFSKLSDKSIALFAKVLKAHPRSKLLIKNAQTRNPSIQDLITTEFAKNGISSDQIGFLPYTQSNTDHLAAYSQIDLLLDTAPYTGTTTTFEALHMGVPVVTLKGESHVSRVSASILTHLGNPQWIAHSEDEYISIVNSLGGDIAKLAEIRHSLRDQLKDSPLRNGASFAKNFQSALSDIAANTQPPPNAMPNPQDDPIAFIRETIERNDPDTRWSQVAVLAAKNGLTQEKQECFYRAVQKDRGDAQSYLQLAIDFANSGQAALAYIFLQESARIQRLPSAGDAILQQMKGTDIVNDPSIQNYKTFIGEFDIAPAKQPLRILVFTNLLPPQELGGYGRTMWEFCSLLRKRGHTVKILTSDTPSLQKTVTARHKEMEPFVSRTLPLYGQWIDGKVKLIEDPLKFNQVLDRNHKLIMDEAEAFKADVAIAGNIDLIGWEMLQKLPERGVPVLHRLGNQSPGYAEKDQPVHKNYCLAGCSQWLNDTLELKGYKFQRTEVVNPGSPIEDYYKFVPPSFGKLRICFAGLMMPYKGSQVLAQALIELHRKGIDFTCEFAGDSTDPANPDHIKSVIAANGMGGKVKFLGFIDKEELAALYARSNIMVFPSIFDEPFGKSQIEAMAAGLLVISSGTGGSKEIVQDRQNGLLFKSENASDLMETLLEVHQNPALAEGLAAQGQIDAFNFRSLNSIEKMETQFYEMLGAD